MSPLATAAGLLAAALVVGPGRPGRPRLRALTSAERVPAPASPVGPLWVALACVGCSGLGWAATGSATAAVLAGLGVGATAFALRRLTGTSTRDDDPADLAGAWELLAVCLEVGLPVAAAVNAAGATLDRRAGETLRRVAGLLELGADPARAWHSASDVGALAAFARAAGRSAATGAGLARAARAEATRLRAALVDAAEARAQRAGVLITAPLGLCFLPAFLVLGIAPVVIGLAGQALAQW
jgi:pilus assembly protein TadC